MNVTRNMKFLPLLPGFNVDYKTNKQNFHKPQHFDKIADGVYYLAEKPRIPELQQPPIYAIENKRVLPIWLTFDKQTLVFKAYFDEEVENGYGTCIRRRMVIIYYYLEDGTLKITEPATSNSGMEQGVLVSRQKILIPSQSETHYFGINELNIEKQPVIYGRTYIIYDCDEFTRRFLTRMGIYVPNPLIIEEENELDEKSLKKPYHKEYSLDKFLKYDRKVLRFYGYWDDTCSPDGSIRDIELYYYLVDDTIELKEIIPSHLIKDFGAMHMKKTKVPKCFTGINPIGSGEQSILLNIIQSDRPRAKPFYVLDPLKNGKSKKDYYTEIDLLIGAQLSIFGKKIFLTDMDEFTKDYYRNKYGLEDFTALPRPSQEDKNVPDFFQPKQNFQNIEKCIPPYNGLGSYDDSLGNCFSIIPKRPEFNFNKFYNLRDHVLRFQATLVSKKLEDKERKFIIRFFLMDDTISVFEISHENSGFERRIFQKRIQVTLPGEELYSNHKPRHFEKNHFYVGATLNLNSFIFQLISADLYALNFMENHSNEFPLSDAKLIMQKIRNALQPCYKEFILEYTPNLGEKGYVWRSEQMREAFERYLEDSITEQEIITIGRKYSCHQKKERHTKEYVRALVHNELKRRLWNNLDRLKGLIMHFDSSRRGFMSRKELYTILRGSDLPLNLELLNSILDHIRKNEEGNLDCQDLLVFLDVSIDPVTPIPTVNLETSLWWPSEKEPDCGTGIDWQKFLTDLDLANDEECTEN